MIFTKKKSKIKTENINYINRNFYTIVKPIVVLNTFRLTVKFSYFFMSELKEKGQSYRV